MATKKGIVLTVIILAAITAASFSLWLIPQNYESEIVISDFEAHLDSMIEIRSTLEIGLDEEFKKMLNEEITTQEYINLAEIYSSQVNALIIQLVESKATEQWHESYLNYLESLKIFNSQIKETIVVATLVNNNNQQSNEFHDIIEKIDSMKKESENWINASYEARP